MFKFHLVEWRGSWRRRRFDFRSDRSWGGNLWLCMYLTLFYFPIWFFKRSRIILVRLDRQLIVFSIFFIFYPCFAKLSVLLLFSFNLRELVIRRDHSSEYVFPIYRRHSECFEYSFSSHWFKDTIFYVLSVLRKFTGIYNILIAIAVNLTRCDFRLNNMIKVWSISPIGLQRVESTRSTGSEGSVVGGDIRHVACSSLHCRSSS